MKPLTAADRLKKAWRAFSVQALVALGSMPLWYPAIEAAATAAFGDSAQTVLQTAIAIGGVLGWIKPQKSISETE